MRRIYFFTLLFFLIFCLGYFLYYRPIYNLQQNNNKINVATSFYPLYFFVSQIAGDKLAVKNITPPGVEPHDYEPTAQDIVFIENSKLLVLNGDGFESWAKKVINNLSSGHTLV